MRSSPTKAICSARQERRLAASGRGKSRRPRAVRSPDQALGHRHPQRQPAASGDRLSATGGPPGQRNPSRLIGRRLSPFEHIRGGIFLAILAVLTGCGGGPAPLPTGRISAYFPAGGVADTIEVDAIDRLPLRRAEFVAPDGRTTAATSIAARPAPSDTPWCCQPAPTRRSAPSPEIRPMPGWSAQRCRRRAGCSQPCRAPPSTFPTR